MTETLHLLSASELAAGVAAGTFSTSEVVTALLERIDALNPEVRALTRVHHDEALAAAHHLDDARAKGRLVGALHGVPFTVKDNIDVAGEVTTDGVGDEGVPAERDAPCVAALRRAGGIVLARSNMPELGLRWHTDNAWFGATRNARDPAVTAGGSSGGEAAAIATGMSPLGLGNDLGGSLRWPAQCCAIASLRPSLGRVPRRRAPDAPSPITFQLMSVEGPLARRVGDLALALGELSAGPAGDPWWTPGPERPVELTRRVRVWHGGDDAGIDAGVDRAASALADAGYDIVEGAPPALEEAFSTWRDLVHSDARPLVESARGLLGADAGRFLDLSFARDPELDRAAYGALLSRRVSIGASWVDAATEAPLLLGPVVTRPPFALGSDLIDAGHVAEIAHSFRLVVAANLLGLPAVAVPVLGEGGSPGAVQIIGTRFSEVACLEAGSAIEQRLGVVAAADPVRAGATTRVDA